MPLENFCTEVLAWCLTNSASFRQSFISALKLPAPTSDPWIISTQSSFKQEEEDSESDDDDDEESECSKRGIFDITIESPRSTDKKGICFIAIESKINSDFGRNQLKKYADELEHKKDSFENCFLITLTINPHTKSYEDRALSWGTVQQLLGEAEESPVKIIYEQFAKFLKEKNMENITIPKMDASAREKFVQDLELKQSMEKILLRVKEREEFKGVFNKTVIYDSNSDSKWLGVYHKKSQPYLYFGIQLEPSFQLVAQSEIPKNDLGWLDRLKKEFQENDVEQWPPSEGTGIDIIQSLNGEFNGDAEKIETWFVRALEAVVKLRHNQELNELLPRFPDIKGLEKDISRDGKTISYKDKDQEIIWFFHKKDNLEVWAEFSFVGEDKKIREEKKEGYISGTIQDILPRVEEILRCYPGLKK